MKNLNSLVGKAGLVLASLVVCSASIGTGSAGADTFRHGGSTATIEQSGGGTSRSEVIRYQDGQTIITRSGNSTDITIQGETDFLVPNKASGYYEWGDSWFDPNRFEQSFPPGNYVFPDFWHSGEREAFKQRILDRMRRRF
jgi:hypothetical protein